MRQSSLFHIIPVVFVCALFLSACGGQLEPEASEIDQEILTRLTRVTTSPIRSMNTPVSQTHIPIPSPSKEATPTNTALATATENPTNTPQPTSEATEKAEIPFFNPFLPESPTPPIMTTLTPTNGSPEEEASQEVTEEATEEANQEPTEEASQEATEEPNEEPNEEPKEARELPPGNTVHFEGNLDSHQDDSYLFLATANSVVLVHTQAQPGLRLSVEVEDMLTHERLEIFSQIEDQDTALYKIPPETGPLYRISVKSVDQSAGYYGGFFIGSAGISFNLLPSYAITARLREEGLLAYMYTGQADTTVEFNFSPHPDDDLDLVVKLYSMDDLETVLLEANESGIGEAEQFLFTPIEEELKTYFITVEEASGRSGKFKMGIQKGESLDSTDDLTHLMWTFF